MQYLILPWIPNWGEVNAIKCVNGKDGHIGWWIRWYCFIVILTEVENCITVIYIKEYF